MSGLKPTGASQPSLQQGYETAGNPVDQQPAEKQAAQKTDNSPAIEQRIPTKQTLSIDEATPSSLGRGIHGAPPGEEAHGGTHESVGRHNELDGEQMRAPGEGDVADIVDKKPGATGEQVDLAADLDRKKAEQASQRSPAPSEEQGVDVQDVLRNR